MGRRPTANLNLPPRMRARPRGRKVWYYFDAGGKPRREIALGADFPEAVRKWAELAKEHEGREASAGAAVSFRDLVSRYQRDVLPTKAARTQRDNLSELGNLSEFFGDCPALDLITPQRVRGYLDWRTDSGKTARVRATREKALLSHLWNKAREWGYTTQANPCRGIEGWSTGRTVYVEDSTFAALYAAADHTLRDALDLAYLTGQRPADVRKLDETAIKDGALEIRQNKTAKPLRILITGELAQVVARIRARKAAEGKGRIVTTTALLVNDEGERLKADALRYRFDKARNAAAKAATDEAKTAKDAPTRAALLAKAEALRAFQFRDLRAKAATDKADSAGDIRQAQRQLGHSSVTTTEKYVRARRGETVAPTR